MPAAPPRSGADPDLLAALHEVVAAGASDLHVSANASPMIRVDGGLRPAGNAVPWERHKVTSALYSIMSDQQREQFEEVLELDFAFTLSAESRFRVNFYQQRGAIGGAFRLIPTEIKQLKELGVPESIGSFAKLLARARARHRPDRFWQVDDARGAHRPREPHARRPHRHRRGPDRVPARQQEGAHQPARGRR